jgi:hypothetical protein
MLLSIGVLLALALGSRAFAPTITFAPSRVITTTTPIRTETALFGREDDTVDQVVEGKKKTGLEDGVRTKLVAESIAPWRTVRLFLLRFRCRCRRPYYPLRRGSWTLWRSYGLGYEY